MIASFFEESIVKKAKEKGLVEIELINLRDFALDSYGTVDDRPYGGGVGMVLRVDVLYKALSSVIPNLPCLPAGRFRDPIRINKKQKMLKQVQHDNNYRKKIILTSPKGKVFNQEKAREYAKLNHLVIIAGHYEGVDERVLNFVDDEVSLGDFVMTGGEITAAAITDAVCRLVPGVLKKEKATEIESFFGVSVDKLIEVVGEDRILKKLKERRVKKVKLLEYPQYTRPDDFLGFKVPKILLSGNHKEIEIWRLKKAYEETRKKRKDLLK
jgi:tRNA (guanine-N1)-methyltransferase